MRMDYLYRFWDAFGDGGFKRMIEDGFVCGDHHFGYAPTYTGPGHASIYTGTTPRTHGIIGNDWYDRSSGASVYCASDADVQTVGIDPANTAGHMSPHRMGVTTIGDELKLATGMQSKVIGVSIRPRAIPAGIWQTALTGSMARTKANSSPAPGTWTNCPNGLKSGTKAVGQNGT